MFRGILLCNRQGYTQIDGNRTYFGLDQISERRQAEIDVAIATNKQERGCVWKFRFDRKHNVAVGYTHKFKIKNNQIRSLKKQKPSLPGIL